MKYDRYVGRYIIFNKSYYLVVKTKRFQGLWKRPIWMYVLRNILTQKEVELPCCSIRSHQFIYNVDEIKAGLL